MSQLALLHEVSLAGLVEHSIRLLRLHQPADAPYYGCFSGGKDSVVIKRLAEMAGVNVAWHYNITTIDPPELIYFIREHHGDVVWDRSRWGNLFHRVPINGLPTRTRRWCCAEYKETMSPVGSVTLLGVRAAESPRRAANWRDVTWHRTTKAWAVAPILHWQDSDVWEFIHTERLPYCSLYDEGFTRLGCVGCPQSGAKGMAMQFARWPAYERLWRRAAGRLWERRIANAEKRGAVSGLVKHYGTAEGMWQWWVSGGPMPGNEEGSCQTALDMLSGGTE